MVCTSASAEADVIAYRTELGTVAQETNSDHCSIVTENGDIVEPRTTNVAVDGNDAPDFDNNDDTQRMLATSATSAAVIVPKQPQQQQQQQQQQPLLSSKRNRSSASIVSAYMMMRNGSVSSRKMRDDANEEKTPFGSPLYFEDSVVVYDKVPPDGGWGWMVLLGTVIVNTLIPGLIKSFGVLFVEFMNVFQATPFSVSIIPALTFALYNLLGPVASVISIKFSCRFATFLGGLSAALGLALSYYANSIEYLYFSYGILGGIGAGMSYTPGILIVGQYFSKRRGLANGICASGSALGSIILPPFLNYLLSEYGHRGAILIMCALVMNVCVGAALYQPVERHLIKVPRVVEITKEVNRNHFERTYSKPDNLKGLILDGDQKKSKNLDSNSPISSKRAALRRPQSNPRFLPGLSSAAEEGDACENCAEVGGTSAPSVSFIVGAGSSPQNVATTTVTGLGMGSTSSNLAPVLSLHRSPSVVSTISSASLAYLSTIYHGSTPAAYQLNQIASGHRDSLSESRGALSQTFGSQTRCLCDPSKNCKCGKSGVVSTGSKGGTEKVSIWKLMFDLALLQNTVFLLITYTVVASGIGYTNLLIMLPAYAASLGMEKTQYSLLLSIIAGADLVGRISGAWISDIASFPCKYLYMGGFIVSGIALMCMPQTTSFRGMSLCCAVFGLSSGIYIGLMAVLLVHYLGAEKLASSFGLSLAVNGVVMLVGPPLFGAILKSLGSYTPVIFILGVIILSGGLILVLEPFANHHENNKLNGREILV